MSTSSDSLFGNSLDDHRPPFQQSAPSLHFPTLTAFSCDNRSASVAILRNRTHRKKYRFRINAQPIPYSTALATPTSALSPELAMWSGVIPHDYRWRFTLDPKNQPPESTLRSNRRRVFEAARSTEYLTLGRRCSCSWCCYTRRKISRRATQEPVKEILEEQCDVRGFDEHVEDLVERARQSLYDELCEDETQVVKLSEDDGPVVDTRWAKLVDDAVGVWEGKKQQWVEKLGWEVCSEHDSCPSLTRLPRPQNTNRNTPCGLDEWTELESSGDYDDNGGGEDREAICRLYAAESAILDVDSDGDWDTMSVEPES